MNFAIEGAKIKYENEIFEFIGIFSTSILNEFWETPAGKSPHFTEELPVSHPRRKVLKIEILKLAISLISNLILLDSPLKAK